MLSVLYGPYEVESGQRIATAAEAAIIMVGLEHLGL